MRRSISTAEAGIFSGRSDWPVANDAELEHLCVSEAPVPVWNHYRLAESRLGQISHRIAEFKVCRIVSCRTLYHLLVLSA